jgi:hypothetical protein
MASERSRANISILDEKAHLPDHVVYRVFTLETVVLNLRTGKYHGLNPTAGRIFELLATAPTVRDAAHDLAEEYGLPVAEIEGEVCRVCSDLAARGLIELNSNRPG